MIHHQACLPMGLVEVGIHSTNQSTNQYLKSHSVILHLKKKLVKYDIFMSNNNINYYYCKCNKNLPHLI